MITRVWRGWTTPENADTYEALLVDEIIPGISARNVPGFLDISLGRRDMGDEVEFITIMWFDSLDSVRVFAGDQYEIAVVPASARAVLTRFDERSAHYETPLPPA